MLLKYSCYTQGVCIDFSLIKTNSEVLTAIEAIGSSVGVGLELIILVEDSVY
jgi:hypothetical protein